MRKTITLLLAAMVVMTAFAQKEGVQQRPAPKAHSLPAAYEKGVAAKAMSLTAAPEKGTKMTLKADVQRDKPAASKVTRPHKATALITEAPEGETKYYNRAGDAYYSSSGSAYSDTQEGLLTIVYADNNEVYLLDPVCYLSAGAYVKGTISGNTITVPLPQTVYNSAYGYNLEIAWVTIPDDATSPITLYDGTTQADRTVTEATFTIDGNTITLNGSSATHLLAGVWDDDDSWYGAGDYNSVYTETVLEDEIVPPAGVTPETYYYSGESYYSSADHEFSSTVQVVKDGNDVYIQGLATGDADREVLPEAWAKGTLNGTTLTIPQGQYMGIYSGTPIYLVGYNNGAVGDITFTYDADADTYTLDNEMFVNGKKDAIYYYCYTEAGALISKEEPVLPTVVEVPDGLVTETWMFTAQDLSFDDDDNPVYEDVAKQVQVGFDGNDVYVQGLCEYLPEAWVKGVRSGNTVTFATGQYFGVYEYWGTEYKMFFLGYGENGICDATFTMNAEENKLTSEDWVVINGKQNELYYWNLYTEPELTKIVEVAAMPAMPSVTSVTLTGTSYPRIYLSVPMVDVDGNPLLTNKLYYKVYTDVAGDVAEYECSTDDYEEIEENMIEIPYDFNDHWDIYPGGDPLYVYGDDIANWRRVGVQSIYYGAGERNATEISWFLIPVDLYIAGSFTDPAWADGKVAMEQDEKGNFTIEVDLPENAEFKLLDSMDNWFGGITDGQNFVITDEQLAEGTELALSIPGMNFVMPSAGKYNITADITNMKMVIEKIEVPADLYVLGDFQGWKPNEGLQMTYDAENKVYTATITPEEEGCFKFTTQLAETEEWTIDEYLWGADSEGDFVVMRDQMGADLSLIAKGQAFRIPAGEWTLTASLEDGTLVIEGEWPEEAMYVAGTFTTWADGKLAMEKGDDGLYFIEVEIEMPEADEGNAEFKFIDEMGKWYGGITDGQNFLITEEQINEQTPLDLSIPGMNFELPFPGNYKLVVDRENMKLVIVKLGDVLVGDVNGDGIVNGSDVTSLYNVLLDDAQVAGDADVNGDGIVNGSDVTALYNILLGD